MSIRSLICCVALGIVISGCGDGASKSSLVEVTGTVTYNGKPLTGATVTMVVGEKGEMANGFTDASGKFKLTTGGRAGAPIGAAKVGITKAAAGAATVDTAAVKPEDMRKMQMAGGGKAADLTPKSEIPEKFGNPTTSGLVATIDADPKKNIFEFPLVD